MCFEGLRSTLSLGLMLAAMMLPSVIGFALSGANFSFR